MRNKFCLCFCFLVLPLCFAFTTRAQSYNNCTVVFTPPSTVDIHCTTPPVPLSGNTSITLPGATVGIFYQVDLSKLIKPVGGVPPYNYSFDPAFVPGTWVTLSPTGLLMGTPIQKGTLLVNYLVTDSAGHSMKVEVKGVTDAQNFNLDNYPLPVFSR